MFITNSKRTAASCVSHLSALLALATVLFATAPPRAEAARPTALNVVPTITAITLTNGQLLASGVATAVLNGETNTFPFSGVPVNLSLADDQTGAGACPILDLELAPINLDVLG